MNDQDNDPFSPTNAPKLSLVVLMRIYDVLMANLHTSNPEAAAKLHETHSAGKILGSLPWLDVGEDTN